MEASPTILEEFAAEARERFARIETRLDQMATRADLLEAIGGLRGEIGGLRGEIGGLHGEMGGLHGEIGGLRLEMYKEFAGMVKWMVGTAVVLGAAAITVMTFVLNYATPPRNPLAPLVQSVPAAQPAPIIIQMPPYPAPSPRQ